MSLLLEVKSSEQICVIGIENGAAQLTCVLRKGDLEEALVLDARPIRHHELMSIRAERQNGTRRFADHFSGDTSRLHMCQTGASVGADDNQIRVVILRLTHNFNKRRSQLNGSLDGCKVANIFRSSVPNMLREKLPICFCVMAARGVLPWRVPSLRLSKIKSPFASASRLGVFRDAVKTVQTYILRVAGPIHRFRASRLAYCRPVHDLNATSPLISGSRVSAHL